MGNRLHLAFKRQVPTEQARAYAEKNGMTFFEVSPLCNFNVIESFTELSRIVLMRHGMEKFWRPNRGGWMLRAMLVSDRPTRDGRVSVQVGVCFAPFNPMNELEKKKSHADPPLITQYIGSLRIVCMWGGTHLHHMRENLKNPDRP